MQASGTDGTDEVEITFARMPEGVFQDIVRKLKALPAVTQVETAADA